ncbi:MAG: LacI family DNA-binding transcriptional regulator [Opitutaceae bacterium]|nr:LacI family DNA-binding transcriptional regulator [Opitutaceae bacterium]
MAATIRSLAAHCGLSTATVSRALAGKMHVGAKTRARIEAAARALGYTRNELVGALMAHLRGARAAAFIGNLAIVHVPHAGQAQMLPQQRRIVRGAQARARELGFQLDAFSLAEMCARPQAVLTNLRARGVLGVIFLYSQPLREPFDFPWDEFVALEIDYGQREPSLHTICHDHYLTLTTALVWLRTRGYRRAGLIIEAFKDERILGKWSAAFEAFQRRPESLDTVPVLRGEKITEAAFARWFRAHQPDVVIGHVEACIGWLKKLGRAVPGDTGFFSLNRDESTVPCAGLDPRLELQGGVAVDALIAQIQRGERGLPAVPRTLMVPGAIVPGPTVRGL